MKASSQQTHSRCSHPLPTWGLLLRYALMGTSSNTYFTQEDSNSFFEQDPQRPRDLPRTPAHDTRILSQRSQSPETTKQASEHTATSPQTLNNSQIPHRPQTLKEHL